MFDISIFSWARHRHEGWINFHYIVKSLWNIKSKQQQDTNTYNINDKCLNFFKKHNIYMCVCVQLYFYNFSKFPLKLTFYWYFHQYFHKIETSNFKPWMQGKKHASNWRVMSPMKLEDIIYWMDSTNNW